MPKAHPKGKHTGRDQELETIVQSISGNIRLKESCSSSSRPLVGLGGVGGGLVEFIQLDAG